MKDLEQTTELADVPRWPRDNVVAFPRKHVRHAAAPVAIVPRNPLVAAALQLMRNDADRGALIAQLWDYYPHASLHEVDQALRETAVTLAAAGVVPA